MAAAFVFTGVQAWRWNDGRQEEIPALRAKLENRSGEDWQEARFRVVVACRVGGERSYEVTLRDVMVGERTVEETALGSIGQVQACEGETRVEFVAGRRYEPAERPAYVVLGFSYQDGDGPVSTDLEGLLDYRRKSDSEITMERVWWEGSGERLAGVGGAETGYYVFRVEPGVMGVAGFLLNKDPAGTGPLARFLRFYEAPAGQAAFLGVFRVVRGPGPRVSVSVESGEDVLNGLSVVKGRPVVRGVRQQGSLNFTK